MSASDRQTNPVLARLEQEAVRAAIPKGLKDERSRQLEYELNWCYNRNNWYFTGGGLLLGLTLGYTLRSVQPLAWAAILAPAGDWLYEQHACRDLQEAFNEHQRRLKRDAREAADRARAEVRDFYGQLVAEGTSPEMAATATAVADAAPLFSGSKASHLDGYGVEEAGSGGSGREEAAAEVSQGSLSRRAEAEVGRTGGGDSRLGAWWWPWGGVRGRSVKQTES
ncbi:hypothetical protein Vafri_14502 [Volvox africanus]|uniref:Uncharacterized protein n=1 Tax=Volvox africanus TaxID=51714 RepID=A0A8J4BEC9_9CHLO|nr:hypothetical protein Vafri_14502 [Volvox africanus]